MVKNNINNVKNNINNLLLNKYNIGFNNMGNKYYKSKEGNIGWYNVGLCKNNGNVLCEIEFELFKEIKSFIEGLEIEGIKVKFDKKKWVSSKEDYEKVILGEGLCKYFGIEKFKGSYEDYLKFLYENKRNIWGGMILKIIY
jgi:hypothetical protein